MARISDKAIELAEFLDVAPTAIEETTYGTFSINDDESEHDGEEYLVYTDEEAEDAFRTRIEDTIDDVGLDAFSKNFQDYIYSHCVDEDWFRDFFHEDYYSYAENIEDDSDDTYNNRLIAECIENNVISEDDLDENGDYDGDTEDLYDGLADALMDSIDNFAEEYKAQFGDFKGVPAYVFDVTAIADAVEHWDGRGQTLASYDGIEEETENFYVYRIN